MKPRKLLVLVTGLFFVRMAINLVHGHSHHELEVPLAPWQHGFVWVVILLAPTAVLAWLWLRPQPAAAWALALLLAAGWAFGLYFHFGPPNPDHVASLPMHSARDTFVWTAVALALIEPVVALTAGWLALALRSERTVDG